LFVIGFGHQGVTQQYGSRPAWDAGTLPHLSISRKKQDQVHCYQVDEVIRIAGPGLHLSDAVAQNGIHRDCIGGISRAHSQPTYHTCVGEAQLVQFTSVAYMRIGNEVLYQRTTADVLAWSDQFEPRILIG
jgi:hypothetical protein